MCGIFALLNANHKYSPSYINDQFNLSQGRGPDNSILMHNIFDNENLCIGFHRLAINGLNDDSNQPFIINKVILICNGEIFNYSKLFLKLNKTPQTNSDCEIILHMYCLYGMEYTLQQLDGEFAFILIDYRDEENIKLYSARDPYGVRPLFVMEGVDSVFGFSSEMKQLNMFDKFGKIYQFSPGNYCSYKYLGTNWIKGKNKSYSTFPFYQHKLHIDYSFYLEELRNQFTLAVQKRVNNTDRPIACLLSGGLDSSLVTALVKSMYDGKLETYSIGLQGSEDLKYARIVADHLQTKHHEIIVTEEVFFDSIPEVIKKIESYDTTTIRASVGNYLIGKYISTKSNAKVIFNGDGADELMGGYLYFDYCNDPMEFDRECKRLLKNIHYFDGLRSDRSISGHGLECRTPFLDIPFVQHYLSIPADIRCHKNETKMGKYLIREAFVNNIYGLLPREILFRKKEAFSDGVSSQDKSWYQIIQNRLETHPQKNVFSKMMNNNFSLEQKYYLYIFDQYYSNRRNIIPYYWMPNYIKAHDPSARTLQNYNMS